MKTCYITTPIYYSSGNVHLGNSYTTIVCDVFARYHRLKGYDTFFLTGMDEHGQKIEKSAENQGKTPQQLVDEVAVSTSQLWKNLQISNDDFIRTSEKRHMDIVQKIFEQLLAQDDIYLSHYEGDYCISCEAFFTKSQLGPDNTCPDCSRPTTKVKEESYFLRLKKYEQQLLSYIKTHPEFIQPETRKNEVVSFIEQGLEDLCVSRTSFSWGIPVLSNPKHVVYVWIDALSNYLSTLGYLSDDDHMYQKFWMNGDEVVHAVGKDILRFHAIYWPIMLFALQVPIRFKLYAHGWVLMNGGKMSKSKGNIVYPMDVIDRYGLDAFRIYMTKEMSLGHDGVFTYERFIEKYNMDLANDLGNLVSRTISMINKYFEGVVVKPSQNYTPFDESVHTLSQNVIQKFDEAMSSFHFQTALIELWTLIGRANKYIDETMPWTVFKDETRKDELNSILYHLFEMLRLTAILLSPVAPQTSITILDELGVDASMRSYDALVFGKTIQSRVIEKAIVLFKRLDMEEEIQKYAGN